MEQKKKEEKVSVGSNKKIFFVIGAVAILGLAIFYFTGVYTSSRDAAFVSGANWGISAAAQKIAENCQPLEVEVTVPSTGQKAKAHLIVTECLQQQTPPVKP